MPRRVIPKCIPGQDCGGPIALDASSRIDALTPLLMRRILLMSRLIAWLLRRPESVLRFFGGRAIVVRDQTLDADAQLVARVMAKMPSIGLDGRLDVPRARRRFDGVPSSHGGRWRVATEDVPLPLEGRTLATRWYEPCAPSPDRGVLVFFHGGGWVIGSIDSHDTVCHQLAHMSGCPVVSVAYRLAPEHAFPAPVEDAVDAVDPLAAVASARGWCGDRVVVGGDSAGGNLAAVVALDRRDKGLPLAGQLLVYPGVDLASQRASHRDFGDGFLMSTEGVIWFKRHYLPDEQDWLDWRASPLRASSHANLAPARLVVAGFDPLHDDCMSYLDVLREAGVDVTLDLYPGQCHGFFTIGDLLQPGQRAVEAAAAQVADWLKVPAAS